jgi:hypothetical protein
MALAMALVAVADAAAVALLALIGVPVWLVIAAGVAFLAGQILLGPAIALALFGARRVAPDDEPELHALTERLCQLADLRKPALAVAEADAPTAFAVGRGERSATICVTPRPAGPPGAGRARRCARPRARPRRQPRCGGDERRLAGVDRCRPLPAVGVLGRHPRPRHGGAARRLGPGRGADDRHPRPLPRHLAGHVALRILPLVRWPSPCFSRH